MALSMKRGNKIEPIEVVASDLLFPEGPISFPDGSIVLVEIGRGTVTHIAADGTIKRIQVRGGPNGAALGPDGAIYVCNNGGLEGVVAGMKYPQGVYSGGRIERVDLQTGKFTVLYDKYGQFPLSAPNDIVFDKHGGFYFTDFGRKLERAVERGGIYYATIDGKTIREVIYGLSDPNGIGLSSDEKVIYWAESFTNRVMALDLEAPGVAVGKPRPRPRFIVRIPGDGGLDSLAIDAQGNICVATIGPNSGITSVSPDGQTIINYRFPDQVVTNICFGGSDLQTAYVTQSKLGQLVKCRWPVPGQPLNFLNKNLSAL